jgi:hypothetical protein
MDAPTTTPPPGAGGLARRHKALLLTLVVVVVLAAVAYQVYRSIPRARVGQIDAATVTAVNPEQRTAEIEFTHPRSGRLIRLKGTLAPAGQLLIDGEPAPLAELRVGDRVAVRGTLYPDYTVTAEWVRVQRSPTSAPAAAPAP